MRIKIKAQSVVEYVVLVSLAVAGFVLSTQMFTQRVRSIVDNAGTALSQANFGR
jgi:hypothetical protein